MLQEERHRVILERLSKDKKVLTDELSRLLKVSADTVRRDLIQIEKDGRLMRVHGGAISIDYNAPFQPREIYAQKEKVQIARKALGLVKDGMTLLLGGGTIMLELARRLPENLSGMLFTVSPLVALEAAQRSTIAVVLLAGKVSRNSYVCTGATVVADLGGIRADLCLMGTNGFSARDGITDYDWEVVQVKKAMMQSSEKTAVLSIAEKKDVVHKLKVCPIHAIDYLVTELEPGDGMLSEYSGHCKVL